jgi:hypothetical protein
MSLITQYDDIEKLSLNNIFLFPKPAWLTIARTHGWSLCVILASVWGVAFNTHSCSGPYHAFQNSEDDSPA